MIFGTGVPVVKLLDERGARSGFITLPRPSRREGGPFENVYTDLGSDATGAGVRVKEGVRFHQKLYWTSLSENQTDMASVLHLMDWSGGDRSVSFRPYADRPMQIFLCTIEAQSQAGFSGMIAADELMVELMGIEVLPKMPNMLYDRPSMQKDRMSVAAAVWDDS